METPVAVVTGATGGIGAAISTKLIQAGIKVFGTYYKTDPTSFFIDYPQLSESNAFNLVKLDINDEKAIKLVLKQIFSETNRIDYIINNAAVAFGKMAALTSKEELRQVFETNLFSQISIMQASMRYVRKSSNGSIVNVASISAFRDDLGTLAYSTSKMALIQATRIFAREMAQFKIRVNSVAPGVTNTRMIEKMDQKSIDLQRQSSALNALADPCQVATVVLFLCSEASSHMTGQCLRVDGGQLC